MIAPFFDKGAERAVLGSILYNEDAAWEQGVHTSLAPDDFGISIHAPIYRAMLALRARHTPIEVLTVRDELLSAGALDVIDAETAPLYTEGFLVSLWEDTWHSHGVRGPMQIVKDWSARRKANKRATAIVRDSIARPMRGWL